jgi:hypothetical protein
MTTFQKKKQNWKQIWKQKRFQKHFFSGRSGSAGSESGIAKDSTTSASLDLTIGQKRGQN